MTIYSNTNYTLTASSEDQALWSHPILDLYPDSPGNDLGVPDRVYRESDGGDKDLYPDSPGSSLGRPDRSYPTNSADDQYPNSPGSDLGVPSRDYKTISERVYK